MKKRYWALVVLLFLVWLDWYIRAPDSRARALTDVIAEQAGPELKNYPYRFRVMRVDDGRAVLSTPRSVEVPAFRMLSSLYPGLDTKNPNDPQFIAAEQLLGRVQFEARAIVLAQPGIKEVSWELDRDWLRSRFIEVSEKR